MDRALKCPCPRCNSTNTRFCYFNNHNLTQPRYLCMACKRYWTQDGSVRLVPIGGRTKKKKRLSSSSSSKAAASNIKLSNLMESSNVTISTNPNPRFTHHSVDLNLGFTQNLHQLPTRATTEATRNSHNTHFINQPIYAYNNCISFTGIALSNGVMAHPNTVHPVHFFHDGMVFGGGGGGSREEDVVSL